MSSLDDLDARNADFWSELCGSSLARHLGIVDRTPESLRRFDDAYFEMYPYLRGYIDPFAWEGARVLEIGLGYGTLGQYLAERHTDYYAVDISPGPMEIMRYRLELLEAPTEDRLHLTTALELPFADESFELVVSIGCLHHTGDVRRGVDEIHRVLRPGGAAVVMLYNRFSFRQLRLVDVPRLRAFLRHGRLAPPEEMLRRYDANAAGDVAPHMEFLSRRTVRRTFGSFSHVGIRAENFDNEFVRGIGLVSRERLLRTPLPRLLGLDLYVTALK